MSLHQERRADAHAADLVERKAERGDPRARADAGGPDDRVRLDPVAVGEDGRVLLDGVERGRDADVDAAPRELAGRVLAQAARDLREDRRRRVDEHPVLRGLAELRVVAHRAANEVGHLGERLDARVAGSDEDEGEVAADLVGVGLGRRQVEAVQHVVAQRDRVGEVLEPEPVVGEARDRERPCDRARGDDQALVADLLVPGVGRDGERARLGVEDGGRAEDQLGVRAHHPQRDDDMARLERSRRGLGQERRVEHEVLAADDRGAALAEQPRDVAAGEPAADDESAAACLAWWAHAAIVPFGRVLTRAPHPGRGVHHPPPAFDGTGEMRACLCRVCVD